MLTYDDCVKLALCYANDARKHPDRASSLWRMALHYQMLAARLAGGEPPAIGEKPKIVESKQRQRRWRKRSSNA
jgi:hypothetical protein